jgi:SAM-dependent methyltransferase
MFDRAMRWLVPSIPVLSRGPLSGILDFADFLLIRQHPEWRHLPPASLRMRIGVGNAILRNHAAFLAAGEGLVQGLRTHGCLSPSSHVLELGCGCGRNALAFAKYLGPGGSYVGMDVDAEMIQWCNKHLSSEGFRFEHVDAYSSVYNPGGVRLGQYRFPAEDRGVTLVVAVSVFSHLLFAEARRYVRESGRVLGQDGFLYATFFLMDFLRGNLGGRWTFRHASERCYVESLRYPEAAVAYELGVVREMLDESGLEVYALYGEESHQQTILAHKVETLPSGGQKTEAAHQLNS